MKSSRAMRVRLLCPFALVFAEEQYKKFGEEGRGHTSSCETAVANASGRLAEPHLLTGGLSASHGSPRFDLGRSQCWVSDGWVTVGRHRSRRCWREKALAPDPPIRLVAIGTYAAPCGCQSGMRGVFTAPRSRRFSLRFCLRLLDASPKYRTVVRVAGVPCVVGVRTEGSDNDGEYSGGKHEW